MITCYDISMKRTVLINPRYVVSMVSMEDSVGKAVEIHLMGQPFMIKVKENAREVEEIKEFFKNYKEED
ncbi:hypothetical protein [Granulicatella adiacens]|uniref:hypothetical protein n=1 Tax=Granulicatella adiacens TaxID=46124 RepID=UPI0021A2E391|nr:hypothetical protein [Granulicatella adiacens]MCT2160032.1 hypothetical protein [Granulicatella adiacens]